MGVSLGSIDKNLIKNLYSIDLSTFVPSGRTLENIFTIKKSDVELIGAENALCELIYDENDFSCNFSHRPKLYNSLLEYFSDKNNGDSFLKASSIKIPHKLCSIIIEHSIKYNNNSSFCKEIAYLIINERKILLEKRKESYIRTVERFRNALKTNSPAHLTIPILTEHYKSSSKKPLNSWFDIIMVSQNMKTIESDAEIDKICYTLLDIDDINLNNFNSMESQLSTVLGYLASATTTNIIISHFYNLKIENLANVSRSCANLIASYNKFKNYKHF